MMFFFFFLSLSHSLTLVLSRVGRPRFGFTYWTRRIHFGCFYKLFILRIFILSFYSLLLCRCRILYKFLYFVSLTQFSFSKNLNSMDKFSVFMQARRSNRKSHQKVSVFIIAIIRLLAIMEHKKKLYIKPSFLSFPSILRRLYMCP
jgi:hypothetical protein